MIDPRLYIEAIKMAKEAGITSEELHRYFPGLGFVPEEPDEEGHLDGVGGSVLPTTEEWDEEMGRIGFK